MNVEDVANHIYSSPEVLDQAIAHVQQKHYPDIPPEKIKPLFVSNPNDPRLRAYNDSNTLYNKGEKLNNYFFNRSMQLGIQPADMEGMGLAPYGSVDRLDFPYKNKAIKPIGFSGFHNGDKSIDVALYKKPVQPVILQKPPIVPPSVQTSIAKPQRIIQKPKTNFEQRIQNPTQVINNADGTSSTHKMMSFEADGKYYAAPTIVQVNGKLVELKPKDAIDYAMKNGEFKEFKTEKEAQQYAEGGYKKGTPLENFKSSTKETISKEGKDFYQGRQFMRETGLRPDYYTRAQIEVAKKNKDYKTQRTISRTLPK